MAAAADSELELPRRRHGVMLFAHRVARFVVSLDGSPPAVEDEVWVDSLLAPGERTLWIQLSNQDRRHSIRVARRFVARRPAAARAELAGALLHDVGKIECHLGTMARVVATLLGPRTPRFRTYLDHEEIGADLAAGVGADPVTVELIRGRGPAACDLVASDYA